MAKYRVRSKVILWPGEQGAWHFAYVDKKNSDAIRKKCGTSTRGFGAIRVKVTVGKTAWGTSIFPDKRSGCFVLPLKATIRRAEGIAADDVIKLTLEV